MGKGFGVHVGGLDGAEQCWTVLISADQAGRTTKSGTWPQTWPCLCTIDVTPVEEVDQFPQPGSQHGPKRP